MKYCVGVDIGGTNVAVGIVNENYEIVSKSSIKTLSNRDFTSVINDIATAINSIISETKINSNDILAIGLGCPGSINTETGIVEYANNLNWHNVPIVDILKEKLVYDIPIHINNDANAHALGEHFAGAGKGSNVSITVTLGTGVGAGIVIDNKLYTGTNFAGAELGHMVIDYDGKDCTCGRKGCFEAYSSVTGLKAITTMYMNIDKNSQMWDLCDNKTENISGRTPYDAYRQGDRAAAAALSEFHGYLASGLTNIINIFQPDTLIVGGGISNEGDNMLNPVREIVSKNVYTRNSDKNTNIVVAKLGNAAGIIGASMPGFAN